jgi:hypothetical protein
VLVETWTPPSDSSYATHNVFFSIAIVGAHALKFEGMVPPGDATFLIDNISLSN